MQFYAFCQPSTAVFEDVCAYYSSNRYFGCDHLTSCIQFPFLSSSLGFEKILFGMQKNVDLSEAHGQKIPDVF